jgi:hypothetical protein
MEVLFWHILFLLSPLSFQSQLLSQKPDSGLAPTLLRVARSRCPTRVGEVRSVQVRSDQITPHAAGLLPASPSLVGTNRGTLIPRGIAQSTLPGLGPPRGRSHCCSQSQGLPPTAPGSRCLSPWFLSDWEARGPRVGPTIRWKIWCLLPSESFEGPSCLPNRGAANPRKIRGLLPLWGRCRLPHISVWTVRYCKWDKSLLVDHN